MAGLRVEQYAVGPVRTNCYFAVNEDTNEALIVDPGDDADLLSAKIKQRNLKPAAVLLTHGHFDHAGAAEAVAREFGILIYAHEKEKETLENPAVNLCIMIGGPKTAYHADVFVKDGEMLELAGFLIRVLYTPGHTAGGCCYYIEKEQAVFSGDTLFCGSIGRTDFPGGNHGTLIRSIREQLFSLPGQTNVYPGHEDTTTIGWEKQHNPFA